MEIVRVSSQPGDLEEFYQSGYLQVDSRFETTPGPGAMLRLLNCLKRVEGPRVWAFNKGFGLSLVPTDSIDQTPAATVISYGDEYTVRYPLPPTESPWPNAWVRGAAEDVEEAARMIQVALQRSANPIKCTSPDR